MRIDNGRAREIGRSMTRAARSGWDAWGRAGFRTGGARFAPNKIWLETHGCDLSREPVQTARAVDPGNAGAG
jgi:hypothetical protein